MFGVINIVTITQVSTTQYPGRNDVFTFNFLTSGNGVSTWAHLTDTFTLVLPRNIYFRYESTGTTQTWKDTPVYGNPKTQPLVLRGDKITVDIGYSYFKPTQGDSFDRTQVVQKTARRFSGYITKIRNDSPMQFECQDNMYALKQTKVENKTWNVDGVTYTLETMLKEMLSKSDFPDAKNFTIRTDNYKHNIGKYPTQGYTMAQVLDDLRKNHHLESFFYGNELHCGIIRYYPEDRVEHEFNFQKNIVGDNLDYQRADDVRIGIVAKSISKVELVTTNSAGKKKTKHKEIKVNVGDQDGEIRTLFFWGITDPVELKRQAEAKLPYLKYEGFRGSFLTFALPYVKHGDSVRFINPYIPEQNGTYLVKKVENIDTNEQGAMQEIFLDIRIDGLTGTQLSDFQSNGI
jgi:hypothetical protein